MNRAVYLDYNASGLVRPQVQAVVASALADGGNPNAVHALGRRARSRIETARGQVAALVGAVGLTVSVVSTHSAAWIAASGTLVLMVVLWVVVPLVLGSDEDGG